jgi:hypothetical protein
MMSFPRPAIRLCACLVLFNAIQAAPLLKADSDPPRRQLKEKDVPAAAAGTEERRITRVYVVDDLTFMPTDYPFHGSLPTTGPFDQGSGTSSFSSGGGPGRGAMGSGGGGGMGGGAGGGGGMFSIPEPTTPPDVLRQFGGGSGAAGQAFPLRGGRPRAAQLINLIEIIVKGEWGGSEGGGREAPDQCIMFAGNLVVRATPEAQQQIDGLLKSLQSGNAARSVTVEACWIVLDAQKLEALRTPPIGTPNDRHFALGLDPKQVSALTQDAAAFRGQITCLNGQTVHLATGQRRVISTRVTPTVGVGAVGYSTSPEVLNIGAVLQLTPIVTHASQHRSAILDLHSVVTQWGKQDDSIKVTSQSFAGMSEKSSNGTLVHHMASIDRVNLGTQEWSTTVEIPLGEPVLVGAATLTDSADQTATAETAKRPQLALVITVRPNF